MLSGSPYHFVGLNIYNANSRDNCSYNMADGTVLSSTLEDLKGSQNVFRAWFYQLLATNREGQRDWSVFDKTLDTAAASGSRVIVTLADEWGDCETPPGQPGQYKGEAWYASGYRQETLAGQPDTYRQWVQEVVARYRDRPTILAWQLMNEAEDAPARNVECSPSAAATLRAWASDMAGLVKSIDSRHLLSLGTIGGGQCGARETEYQILHDIPGVDLCEYHDYGQPDVAVPGDQYNGLAQRIQQCRALGKPLFVGEMGIETSRAGSLQARADLIDSKITAQLQLGVAGVLLWAWTDGQHGGSSATSFDIGPGDPVLRVLRRHL